MLQHIKKFLTSRPRQQGHLLFAISAAFAMRLMVLVLPFRWYRGILGHHLEVCDYCPLVGQQQLQQALQCGRFTTRISAKLPLAGECMVSALTFALYARRYDIPYVIHLGVTKKNFSSESEAPPSMRSHAWVQVRGAIVSGWEGVSDYQPVASFCHPQHLPLSEVG